MLSAQDQCEWMEMMMKLTGAKKGIEIGVFTGYSALCMANGLPEDGKLICCDISEEFMNIGKPFWQQAGVADKIDVRIGPALDTLNELGADEANLGAFDFAYVDADKTNYNNYVQALYPLLKTDGYIMIDNTIWSGKVADPDMRENDETTKAVVEVVQNLLADSRFEVCTLMIADGVTLARKK